MPREPALLSLLLLVQVGGCAAQPKGGTAPARHIDVDPVRVEVDRERGEVSMFDARELFDRAGAALDAGRHQEALVLYDKMVASFPDSELVPPALFNAGLALEGQRDLEGAIARYLEAARRSPESRHALDCHIRSGALLASLQRWSEALRVFDDISRRGDLDDSDRIELGARRGHALVESARYSEAETALVAAIELGGRAARHDRKDGFIAMARYYVAEIPRRQAIAVELRLPEAEIQRGLEAKAKLVLEAQRRFEDTIRVGDLHWATAAGYQLGSMQEEMWRALLAAPVPTQLSAEEAKIYAEEVRGLALAHLEKALEAHLMNVRVADLHRTETPWSRSSRQRSSAIRQLLAPPADASTTASRRPR